MLPAPAIWAQSSAGRQIRVIVPLPAGSSNDTSTRAQAPILAQFLGQPVVIDNKAGGGGIIGTMEVVKAQPDGLTLMAGSLSPLATNAAT
jgi:tripartite-type tricarboxylate transporter receptor subunit TctC